MYWNARFTCSIIFCSTRFLTQMFWKSCFTCSIIFWSKRFHAEMFWNSYFTCSTRFSQKCSEMHASRSPGFSESLPPLPEQHWTRWNLIFNTINLPVTNFVRWLTTHRLCKTGHWFYLARYACCTGGYFESVLLNTIQWLVGVRRKKSSLLFTTPEASFVDKRKHTATNAAHMKTLGWV